MRDNHKQKSDPEFHGTLDETAAGRALLVAKCGLKHHHIAAFAALFVAFLTASVAVGQELCLNGCPKGAPATNRTINRTIYILNNNGERKFADWVAYRVTRDTIGSTKRRAWRKDPDLPANETLSPLDYRSAREALKVDRGHQAPLASFTGHSDWKLLNFLSNITPQIMDLNEGAWERLEAAERTLAKFNDISAVYSVTGPLYERAMPSLPHARKAHTVPSGYWKIMAVEQSGKLRSAAFIMDQSTPRKTDFCNSMVTVREVERRSGLIFFPDLQKIRREQLGDEAGGLSDDLGCRKTGAAIQETR